MTAIKSHTTYRTKSVTDLTESEFMECWQHNLIAEGLPAASMRPKLWHIKRREEQGWATILRDSRTKEFLGWALTFVGNGYNVSPGTYVAYYYVLPDHRRKGYGSILHRIVKRKFGEVTVVPWDDRSHGFFDAVGAKKVQRW